MAKNKTYVDLKDIPIDQVNLAQFIRQEIRYVEGLCRAILKRLDPEADLDDPE